MKYLSYRTDQGASWGALDEDKVVDLGGIAPTLKQAIARDLLPENLPEDATRLSSSEVEFLPVIPDPGKILCVGLNYRAHAEEAGRTAGGYPTIFTRFADTQIGHGQPACRPNDAFDYEGELAVVIGRDAHHVSRDEAMSVVAGYSCYNDFTVRDWQAHTSQWTPGKNFPGTGAFGPYLVPRDEVLSVADLTLTTRVNGETRQSAPVSLMVFDISELVAYASSFTPLAAGDVIVSGTPGGIGYFMDPPTFLQDGDEVEVEVSGIGVLRNTVASV
jgi:2-keto-4-pentenoate hydratase/2-oxohepta-3-ene-1,7-dioic acid hydratase in catechol pathway